MGQCEKFISFDLILSMHFLRFMALTFILIHFALGCEHRLTKIECKFKMHFRSSKL